MVAHALEGKACPNKQLIVEWQSGTANALLSQNGFEPTLSWYQLRYAYFLYSSQKRFCKSSTWLANENWRENNGSLRSKNDRKTNRHKKAKNTQSENTCPTLHQKTDIYNLYSEFIISIALWTDAIMKGILMENILTEYILT